MKFILGKKIGMSQVFIDNEDAKKVVPVTLIEVGPCVVTQVRAEKKDGYKAVQIGFLEKKKINKPLAGHLKELGKFRHLREFRLDKNGVGKDKEEKVEYKIGDKIDASVFETGDKIKISGVSKAKGFQGVMKRHGFKCGQASHGQKHSNRKPGSIGSAYPEHVIKGRKMAGRMGGVQSTQLGLEVVEVDKEKNLLIIKGAVPGNNGVLVRVVGK
ncbi:MAG: 50S ribosomal protein L3 [Candidatus Pacebacteria bacterium]|nr:50S ribosomal protein L3 [Candidatus Paceibacterota bacterium]